MKPTVILLSPRHRRAFDVHILVYMQHIKCELLINVQNDLLLTCDSSFGLDCRSTPELALENSRYSPVSVKPVWVPAHLCDQSGAAMRLACSNNIIPEDHNVCSVKGIAHTKVYPFTVSLPRYASWRGYVRTLLNQLKSCPNCRAAGDEFPISVLPKVHKLPNGKILIFKGLTSGSNIQSPCFNGADDCHSERAFSPQARKCYHLLSDNAKSSSFIN